jgi:hypothetical protein
MKRLLFVALLALASCMYLPAQVPVTVTSNTDPGTIAARIQQLQDLASQVQNGIQTLEAADEMVQYQIQSLQQLSSGTWQGFVNAWDYETSALNNFAYLSSQIQPLNAAVDTTTFVKTWTAASGIVHSTDSLVKDTQMREALWKGNLGSSSAANTTVGQLQAVDQGLQLVGGEVEDMNMTLGATKQYFVTRAEIEDAQNEQTRQIIDNYYETDYLSNTDAPVDLSQRDASLSTDSAW